MSLPEVVIEPKNQDGKGRAFRAMRLCVVMADSLWEYGESEKHHRPIYASFIGSENELRPFVANLLCGRPAVAKNDSYRDYRRSSGAGYEFMKSATYKTLWQRFEEGAVATVYLPELLALDPGMVDPKGIKFVALPGAAYLENEATKMDVTDCVTYVRSLPLVKGVNEPYRDYNGHIPSYWKEPLPEELLAAMVPLSYLFTLYLSNRSRAPIPPDGRFYLQLLVACLHQGLASWSSENSYREKSFGQNVSYRFIEVDTAEGKLAPGVAFSATHEEIEELLAKECETYFNRIGGKA